MYDLIVVGGGPAGLTATVYAIRKRLNVLMVSKDLGGKTNYRLALPWIEDYQVIRGLEIVNKFRSELEYLKFARHMEPRMAQVSVPEVIEEVLGFFGKEAEYRSIDIVVDIEVSGSITKVKKALGQLEPEFIDGFTEAIVDWLVDRASVTE